MDYTDPGYYWIVGPKYTLGEKEFRIVYENIVKKLRLGSKIKKSYNVQQGNMHIEMPWGSVLEVKSAERQDTLLGEALNGVVMAEAARHTSDTWEQYIRPSLSDKRGWAIFASTPRGYNWYQGLWMLGQFREKYPHYESWRLPSGDDINTIDVEWDDPGGNTMLMRRLLGTADEAVDFPEGAQWLNTDHPLTMGELKGRIVLLDFWTYCCINCMHVIPDLGRLEEKYPELVVVGVHSAKLENERDAANISAAILRYDIKHPVIVDNGFALWRAYGIHAWPSFVLIDPVGNVVGHASGEGAYEMFDGSIASLSAAFGEQGLLRRERMRFNRVANAPAPQAPVGKAESAPPPKGNS